MSAVRNLRCFTQSSLFQILKKGNESQLDVNAGLAHVGEFLRAVAHLRSENRKGKYHHNLFEIDAKFLNTLKQLVGEGNVTGDKRKHLYFGMVLISVVFDPTIVNISAEMDFINKSVLSPLLASINMALAKNELFSGISTVTITALTTLVHFIARFFEQRVHQATVQQFKAAIQTIFKKMEACPNILENQV